MEPSSNQNQEGGAPKKQNRGGRGQKKYRGNRGGKNYHNNNYQNKPRYQQQYGMNPYSQNPYYNNPFLQQQQLLQMNISAKLKIYNQPLEKLKFFKERKQITFSRQILMILVKFKLNKVKIYMQHIKQQKQMI